MPPVVALKAQRFGRWAVRSAWRRWNSPKLPPSLAPVGRNGYLIGPGDLRLPSTCQMPTASTGRRSLGWGISLSWRRSSANASLGFWIPEDSTGRSFSSSAMAHRCFRVVGNFRPFREVFADQAAHGGFAAFADAQVTFPVAGHPPARHLGRAVLDAACRRSSRPLSSSGPWFTLLTAGAQGDPGRAQLPFGLGA